MKKALAILLLLPALALADVKSDINKRYDTLAKAIMKKDAKAVVAHFTADYIDIDENGKKMNKAQYQKQLEGSMKQPFKVTSAKITIKKVTAKGKDQLVDLTAVLIVEFQQNGKTLKASGTMTAQDTWRQEKGVWMCSKSHVTKRVQKAL